jgi:hypothetical protein
VSEAHALLLVRREVPMNRQHAHPARPDDDEPLETAVDEDDEDFDEDEDEDDEETEDEADEES